MQLIRYQVIKLTQGPGRSFYLGLAYVVGTIENLAGQVGKLHLVGIGEAEGAHTSGR